MLKKYSIPIIMWLVFESIAVILWQALDNIFYLFNFSYIGTSIAIGLFLFARKQQYARHVIQFAVGLYMLGYLGFLQHENMQIEGFWYYLFLGVFEAATIHYAVAKIFGPFIFGRGWCGYACWTAMILDLLPFKTPASSRRKWGFIRYIVFVGSLIFVSSLFLLHVQNIEQIMWYSFLIGNLIYYVVGIALAFICKDNRAFCKYICPVTVFLKPASRFALFHIKLDPGRRMPLHPMPDMAMMLTGTGQVRRLPQWAVCKRTMERNPTAAKKRQRPKATGKMSGASTRRTRMTAITAVLDMTAEKSPLTFTMSTTG